MDKEKITNFYYEVLAGFVLPAFFIAITILVVKSSSPGKILFLYLFCEIGGFVLFSIYVALIVALAASFVAVIALIINPGWLIVASFFSYWAVAGLLGWYLRKLSVEYGECKIGIEKKENEIGLLEAKIEKYKSIIPDLSERVSRYSKISDFSLKLATSFDFEKISRYIIEFSKEVFSAKSVFLVSHPGDIYDRWIYENQKPLWVENISTDYRFPKIYPEYESLIAYPVFWEGKIYSIIKIFSESVFFEADDLRFLGAIASLSAIAFMNAGLFEQTQQLAITDGLTGLYNHSHFLERLEEEVHRAKRFGKNFAFMMLDIDHFKNFNDSYGHPAGDEVLRRVADRIRKKIRSTDIVGRYGGEEFSVILPETDAQKALRVAEGIRKAVKSEKFNFGGSLVTVSVTIGISIFPSYLTGEKIVAAADKALYKGKESGRDRVVLAK